MPAIVSNASNYWLAGGWTMFHFLWMGTLIWPAAAFLKILLRRSPAGARYSVALGLFVLTAMIPACLWGVALLRPHLFLPIATSVESFPVHPDRSAGQRAAGGAELDPGADSAAREREFGEPLSVAPSAWCAALGTLAPALSSAAYRLLPWLWVVGAPSALTLLACGVAGTEHLRRRSRPTSPEWRAICLRLRTLLGVRVQVTLAVCDRIASPVLVGIVRPIILLPPAVLADCSPEQIEMILLHELAHVRRWDNLVNLLQRLVEALLFFHPFVWWLSSWVRREREECCDRMVVAHTGRPQEYAEALAALALPGIAFPRAAVAMADRHLVGRIRHILNLEEEAMSVSRIGLLFAAVTLLACGCLAFSFAPAVQPALLAAEEKSASPDVTASEAIREAVETADTRCSADKEFGELVEQYERQMSALRFEDALETAKKARSLEPQNKRVNTMLLKARYGRLEHYKKVQGAAPLAAPPDVSNGAAYAPEQTRALIHDRRELRILQALQKRVWFNFSETPLRDVIQEISKNCQVNVMISATAMTEVGLTPDTRIGLRANGARLGTFLDQILRPLHLDYAVKDDVLKIATPRELGLELDTRSYPVADLVTPAGGKLNAVDARALGQLIQRIVTTVLPESWEEHSGPGSIVPYRTTLSLVIRQTPAVHEQVAEFLAKLRSERRDGEAVEHRPDEKGKAASARVAELEERIKKLEAELSAIRESLKQADNSEE